jgi:hypothetical protein
MNHGHLSKQYDEASSQDQKMMFLPFALSHQDFADQVKFLLHIFSAWIIADESYHSLMSSQPSICSPSAPFLLIPVPVSLSLFFF